jgi:hypothetical protein
VCSISLAPNVLNDPSGLCFFPTVKKKALASDLNEPSRRTSLPFRLRAPAFPALEREGDQEAALEMDTLQNVFPLVPQEALERVVSVMPRIIELSKGSGTKRANDAMVCSWISATRALRLLPSGCWRMTGTISWMTKANRMMERWSLLGKRLRRRMGQATEMHQTSTLRMAERVHAQLALRLRVQSSKMAMALQSQRPRPRATTLRAHFPRAMQCLQDPTTANNQG